MNIPLRGKGKGMFILVDDTDAWLSNYSWCINYHGYPVTTYLGKQTELHRIVMKPTKGFVVDHINHNKLDNTRVNLRVCTQSDNLHNALMQRNNTTGYKGVTFDKLKRKYRAQIKLNNKKLYIGLYCTAEEAAGAYYTKAIELFGEYAYV